MLTLTRWQFALDWRTATKQHFQMIVGFAANPPVTMIIVINSTKVIDLTVRLRRSHCRTFKLYMYTFLNIMFFASTSELMGVKAQFHDWQVWAVSWMLKAERKTGGGFLCDDMGLGKNFKINIPSSLSTTMRIVRAIRSKYSRRRCSGTSLNEPMLRRLRELALDSKCEQHSCLEISAITKLHKRDFPWANISASEIKSGLLIQESNMFLARYAEWSSMEATSFKEQVVNVVDQQLSCWMLHETQLLDGRDNVRTFRPI